MDLAELRVAAAEYAQILADAKRTTPAPRWGWYPYPMLPGHVDRLDALLTGEHRKLFSDPANTTVADVGGADGDFGFFLESQRFQVELFEGGNDDVWELAVERPERLKAALGSQMPIHRLDFDRDFALPRRYDIVLFLNVLYHLRNPMLALDVLARSSRYLVLATKIASRIRVKTPLGPTAPLRMDAVPVAYLLDPNEANPNDASNYWVFTEASLRRLLGRCGLKVLDWLVVGNLKATPADDPDARAWCLLESTVVDGYHTPIDLLRA